MKRAAIVIGGRNTGKSTTIREFKKLVTMEGRNKFTLLGKPGFIYAMSFEEANRDVEATVETHSGYDFLVFACQGPKLKEVHDALDKFEFLWSDVKTVMGEPLKRAREQAGAILKFLKSK